MTFCPSSRQLQLPTNASCIQELQRCYLCEISVFDTKHMSEKPNLMTRGLLTITDHIGLSSSTSSALLSYCSSLFSFVVTFQLSGAFQPSLSPVVALAAWA